MLSREAGDRVELPVASRLESPVVTWAASPLLSTAVEVYSVKIDCLAPCCR